MLELTDQEKLDLLNKVHKKIFDYGVCADEVKYLFAMWDAETKDILGQLGIDESDLIMYETLNNETFVDIAQFAFTIADWWTKKRGFMFKLPFDDIEPEEDDTITRYIETDMSGWGDDMAWECEQCKDVRVFDEFHPRECVFHFCPACGRKITEFVDYVEEADEEVD